MTGKIYKFAFVVILIAGIVSCSKTNDDPAAPGADDRDKLVGTWICNETSNQAPATYNVTISKANSPSNGILLKNFYQEGANATNFATVDGNFITLTKPYVGSDTLSGGGTYNSNTTIDFTFTVRDGQTVNNVTARFHH